MSFSGDYIQQSKLYMNEDFSYLLHFSSKQGAKRAYERLSFVFYGYLTVTQLPSGSKYSVSITGSRCVILMAMRLITVHYTDAVNSEASFGDYMYEMEYGWTE